jgi:hypothetical protein
LNSLLIKAQRQHEFPAMRFIAPYSWETCRLCCQIACFVVAAYILVDTYWVIRGFNNYGIARYKAFRLEVVEAVQDLKLPLFGKFEIALLLRGCVIASSNFEIETSRRISDYKRLIDLNVSSSDMDNLALDGFRLTYDGNSNSSSRLRFTLAGSDDDWKSSFPMASSEARLVAEGVRVLDASSNAWAAGGTHVYENHLSWTLILSSAVHPILFALLCAFTALYGALNRPLIARRFTALFCALITVNMLTAVIGSADSRAQNLSNGAAMAVFSILGAVLVFDEYYFPAALAVLGLLWLAARLVEDLAVNDPGYLLASPPFLPAAFLLIGIILVAQRQLYLRGVLRAARAAGRAWDDEWLEQLARPSTADALRALAAAAERLTSTSAARLPVRQRTRLLLPSASSSMPSRSDDMLHPPADGDGELQAVTSLDQLYTQAACLAPMFYEQVRARF